MLPRRTPIQPTVASGHDHGAELGLSSTTGLELLALSPLLTWSLCLGVGRWPSRIVTCPRCDPQQRIRLAPPSRERAIDRKGRRVNMSNQRTLEQKKGRAFLEIQIVLSTRYRPHGVPLFRRTKQTTYNCGRKLYATTDQAQSTCLTTDFY